MADDRLRMAAEVVDKFSGPLRELQKLLKGVATDQQRYSRDNRIADEQAAKRLDSFTRQIKEGLRPALDSVGLSIGGVAGAITAIGGAGVRFAGMTNQLNQLSGQVGINIQHIREFAAVGELVGVPFEQSTESLKAFAENITELRHNWGGTYDFLKQRRILVPLMEDIQHSRTDFQALLKVIDGVRKLDIPPSEQRKVLRAFGLPEDIAALKGSIQKNFDEAGQHIARVTQQSIENAERFRKAWRDTKLTFDNLANAVGSVALGPMIEGMEHITKLIEGFQKISKEGHFPGEMYPSMPGGGGGFSQWWKQFSTPQVLPGSGGAQGWNVPGRLPPNSWGVFPHGDSFEDRWSAITGAKAEDAKKAIQQGAEEGVRQGLADALGGGDVAGTAGVIGGGGMIGARPGFGGFRPRVPSGAADAIKGGIGDRSDVGGLLPASVRYNNPGAQYPSARARQFGMEGYGVIGGGHLIARFPTPEQGAAANMDLLDRNYAGMTIGAAGAKWTGGNGFGVPGYNPNAVLSHEMLRDRESAIAFMKAIAAREAGRRSPLTDDQWRKAHEIFLRGGIKRSAPDVPSLAPGPGASFNDRFGTWPQGGLLDADTRRQEKIMSEAKISGGASLQIDMRGLQKGTRSRLETWGIFDDATIYRGRTSELSGE